ncbi:hypothetical protein BLEM_1528 [Bifidobacterium lemurum]|uniref:Uncharacterized protein n=1 Tax=Bifidobacterium lemurum TaxID=1603886 RepID=A0A261FR85_9BIFI|nr:hypothetical protein [Bifidobacterium lemurum]OZG61316.1 hypothetical protein BLEM_1528 [Bifidobacterium lemurum]QOL34705.1 hypothetical protein BL8807_01920 [Bifidobacterium lemurum]
MMGNEYSLGEQSNASNSQFSLNDSFYSDTHTVLESEDIASTIMNEVSSLGYQRHGRCFITGPIGAGITTVLNSVLLKLNKSIEMGLPTQLVYFDADGNGTSKMSVLHAFARNLNRVGIPTPYFDCAYFRTLAFNGNLAAIRLDIEQLLNDTKKRAFEVKIKQSGRKILSWLPEGIGLCVPLAETLMDLFVENVCCRDWKSIKAANTRLKEICDYKQGRIFAELSKYLKEDIESWTTSKDGIETKLVVFVDSLNKIGAPADKTKDFFAWFGEMSNAARSFWIFVDSSASEICRSEDERSCTTEIKLRYLNDEEAKSFLEEYDSKAANVDEEAKYAFAMSKGSPAFLRLFHDIWQNADVRERIRNQEYDFSKDRTMMDFVDESYLQQLETSVRGAVYLCAFLGKWTDADLINAFSNFGFNVVAVDEIRHLSFIRVNAENDEYYEMDDVIAYHLRLYAQTNSYLVDLLGKYFLSLLTERIRQSQKDYGDQRVADEQLCKNIYRFLDSIESGHSIEVLLKFASEMAELRVYDTAIRVYRLCRKEAERQGDVAQEFTTYFGEDRCETGLFYLKGAICHQETALSICRREMMRFDDIAAQDDSYLQSPIRLRVLNNLGTTLMRFYERSTCDRLVEGYSHLKYLFYGYCIGNSNVSTLTDSLKAQYANNFGLSCRSLYDWLLEHPAASAVYPTHELLSQAVEACSFSYTIRKKIDGEEASSTLRSLINLVSVYWRFGLYLNSEYYAAQASELSHGALQVFASHYSADYLTLRFNHALASRVQGILAMQSGDSTAARRFLLNAHAELQEVLIDRESSLGSLHRSAKETAKEIAKTKDYMKKLGLSF